jgi:chromosome segregation ATPase
MAGGSRIIAFGSGAEGAASTNTEIEGATDAPIELVEAWIEPASQPEIDLTGYEAPLETHGRSTEWLAPTLAAVTVAGWTGFFLWVNRDLGNVAPKEIVGLIANWATPVLLVCVGWLISMRTSRREAVRFGNVAHLLSIESARLEERLTVVNRELSLAREFIAAQSRDLESLGRIATDRLSQNADRLQELVKDNSAQVDAIAGVSTTALDNMEKLRGQLPVIASSAKDVANNIAHAGRTAQSHLAEMVNGFTRLNSFGEASERHVASLRERIDAALTSFKTQLDHLQGDLDTRLGEMERRSGSLRSELDSHEVEALSAIRSRAAALAEELEQARTLMDSNEAESLTSLRARLTTLRDESTALTRALRDGETGAMQGLQQSTERMDKEIRRTIEMLDTLDKQAVAAARARIVALTEEAGNFDARLAERNRQFSEETDKRLEQAKERHDAEVERLSELLQLLDSNIEERRNQHELQSRRIASHGEAIAARIEVLNERIAAVAAFGNMTEESLSRSLQALADRLVASRDALAGTDGAIAQLTDDSVRLLELIQASAEKSRNEIPAALATGEAQLSELEQRIGELFSTVERAAAQGSELSQNVALTRASISQSLGEIGALQEGLEQGASRHGQTLEQLRATLHDVSSDSTELAERAQGELTTAIERLAAAAREAVTTLENSSQGTINAIAEKLGDESAAAVERTLRVRTAEAIAQLEQSTDHAAGISREAAIQLRDQLAKVDELTGNLERRVAQARERAEEQVDGDFARRVALITESLNSNAIDIAKALSTEVTDTAWAAYLRGDRGVFTRRAVRLLDSSEAKSVSQIYDEDREFREHVSRYIHDFEGMLRQLLSTRDGHALGVTLLSSDMGKLYVALAQGIERLRN